MQKKLINYTNDILDYIQKIPLSDSTVRYYGCCYKALTDYCQSHGYEFSSQIADEFLKYEESRYLKNEIGKIYYLLMKILLILFVIHMIPSSFMMIIKKFIS